MNQPKNTEPILYDVYENQTQYYLSSVHTAVLLKQKGEKKKNYFELIPEFCRKQSY